MTADWFPGEGRDADEQAFLARLRALASEKGLADVPSAGTHAHGQGEMALVVCAVVPGMADREGEVALQVGWAQDRPGRPFFVGEWNGEHDYLIDGWEQVDLAPPGDDVTPEACADLAHDWLTQQLRRPLERVDWTSGRGSPRSEWYFMDTGQRLWDDGYRWGFFRRRPDPDRVVRLR